MKLFSGYRLVASFLGLFLASASYLSAQNASVIVEDVKFDMVDSGVKKNEHWSMAVELTGGRTADPQAVNPKFVDDIEVTVLIGFKLGDAEFQFFDSKVEIITLEEGEDAVVRFYLEPEIVDRLNLPKEPYAYLVEIEAAGEAVTSTRKMRADYMKTPALVESFKTASRKEGVSDNNGLLVPVYDSIFWTGVNRGELQDTPAYKRKPSN